MLEKINRIINDFIPKTTTKNEAIVLVGPICSGKTSYRKQEIKNTHIVLDAAEIYLKLNDNSAGGFGEHLTEELNFTGSELVKKIIANRYSFVFEIMPDQHKNLVIIINELKRLGYKTIGIKFDSTEEEAIKRNIKRDQNNISSYFTENFHIAWLLNNIRN
jgi:predicted kinase